MPGASEQADLLVEAESSNLARMTPDSRWGDRLNPMTTFVFPNRITFGPGAVDDLPSRLRELEVARPLVVTDPGLAATSIPGVVAELAGGAPIFDGVESNPTEENVEAGLNRYREGKCDGVIGLGGGSAIDCAKGIRLRESHPGPIAQYAFGNRGWERMTNPMVPLVAISTTAGTGSDVARGSVLIVQPSGAKVGIVGDLYPSHTIADPELTASMPPPITAGTGMDALTHCVEEYIGKAYHPFVDGMTLEGVRLCHRALERVYRDGSDIDGRGDMMVAAMIGGIGFTKGLGVIHSLSHAFGAVVGGHHGTVNAILLPAALEFNRRSCLRRFRALAAAVDIAIDGMTDDECADAFIGWVSRLNASLDIPADLSAFGAKPEHIEPMVALAEADHCHRTNPRPCTTADFESLFRAHIPG